MIIDICGFSGAGKTTIQRSLMARLKQEGYNVVRYIDLVQPAYLPESTSRFISVNAARSFNYFLTRYRFENPEFMAMVDEISRFEYMESVLLAEVLACYASAALQDDPKLVAVIDEGIIYRLSVLYREFVFKHLDIEAKPEVRAASLERFAELIDLVAGIDVAVFLDVPAELCRARAFERRMYRRSKHVENLDLDKMYQKFNDDYPKINTLKFQEELFDTAMKRLAAKNVTTCILDQDLQPEESVRNILQRIQERPKPPSAEEKEREAQRLQRRKARRQKRRAAALKANSENTDN